MPPLDQNQIAQQMVAQLRIIDPSVSAEIGTPERKIIDTVAQAIAEAGVDANLLTGALDLDAKFGANLDAFLSLFGFGRQQGAFATGFVTFGRATASPYDITIPRGTQVLANVVTNGVNATFTFQVSAAVTLPQGSTQVIAPIQALLAGSSGNVAVGAISQFANLGAPPLGITSVLNEIPTTGGSDIESDSELKIRFRNTVFRNLSGTEDQFLALALATQFTTKANVLGPVSRYREYIQVPLTDDSTNETGGTVTVVEPDGSTQVFAIPPDGPGNGLAGEWTTTPSNNPYAKYIYVNIPYFVSNGNQGTNTVFYRQDTDFILNAPPADVGETYRESNESPADIANPSTTPNNPNITFLNVYTGVDPSVTLPRPNDVCLLEYSYLSLESRNDVTRNITNCVDVYVNGENPTVADAVIPPPPGGVNLFTNNPIDKFYAQNFRRIGQPDAVPIVGHIFTALFWQPVIALPDSFVVGDNTFYLGPRTDGKLPHYWAVEDKTLLGNTVRTRNGLEWDPTAHGQTGGDPDGGPYTGATITTTGVTSITIPGYTYDKNIIDLQAAIDGAKQVTTDALAHRATRRYFKLDVTVVYGPGASIAGANQAIADAVTNFFNGQYFGSVIQLSDLLSVIRNTFGVQNVRWSNDVIHPSDDGANTLNRITETDVNGHPRSPAVVYNTDFYLRDSELPMLPVRALTTDTLPGLIIRPRAQGTFTFS